MKQWRVFYTYMGVNKFTDVNSLESARILRNMIMNKPGYSEVIIDYIGEANIGGMS